MEWNKEKIKVKVSYMNIPFAHVQQMKRVFFVSSSTWYRGAACKL